MYQKEIDFKLKLSAIIDLIKPEITKFERAELLKNYMKDNNLGLTEFCNQFGFKKTTVHSWLSWNKITEAEYNRYRKEGYTKTDITNIVKGDKLPTKEEQLLKYIKKLMALLNKNSLNINETIIDDLKELRNKINLKLYRYEK